MRTALEFYENFKYGNWVETKFILSYDVFQWITLCHKYRMTTRVLTLLREYVTSLMTSVTTM